MKISIIHNTYKDNPLIRETVILNLHALRMANVDYQYIVFNDNGDKNIGNQVSDLPVLYHYSDYNFGKRMCSGGWVGALPLVEGELIHNTGQDDVFTDYFYRVVYDTFHKTDCDLVYCNGVKVDESLVSTNELLGTLQPYWNYDEPRKVFNEWLGVQDGKITRSNNYIPAPGTVYKKSLHEEIGLPDIETFRGVADFEYWVRVLFFNKKVKYVPTPSWLYRLSRYTTTMEVIDGKLNEKDLAQMYLNLLKNKFQELLDNE